MKTFFLSLTILILISCNTKIKKDIIQDNNKKEHNIVNKNVEQKEGEKTKDSLKNTFLDTQKTKSSPVKIISSKLLNNQYSDHKDIQLIYKNVTHKKINAIKFEWYCENAFDKPASGQFFFIKGISNGHTDISLKPRDVHAKIWEDFSTDANKIIAARAYYVVFSDGTKWELK